MLIVTIEDVIFITIVGLFILGMIGLWILVKIEDLKKKWRKRKVKEE